MDEDTIIRWMDYLWHGVVLLGFFVIMFLGARAKFAPLEPDPVLVNDRSGDDDEAEEKTLADWRNGHAAEHGAAARWVECPCCGCPTLDAEEDFAECELCGWDGDVDALEEARRSFAAYGCAFTPEETAALGRAMPSDDERRIIRRIASRCAAANPDRPPSAAFWTELDERLAALRAARTRRPGAGAP